MANPDTKNMPKGIDVSHAQGTINWQLIPNGQVHFVFIKATEATSFVDPLFHRNWQGAKDRGIAVGAYHFFRSNHSGKEQAEHFLQQVLTTGWTTMDLPLVVDIETSDGVTGEEMSSEVEAFLDTIFTQTQQKAMIYTNPAFWDSHIPTDFANYPLWVADWAQTNVPKLPKGWSNWQYWQTSDRGSIPGIATKVDVSIANQQHKT